MEPDALGSGGRPAHGGSDDPTALDFSANTNPERPPGVARVYESALSAARRYPSDGYADYREAAADYVDCGADAVVPTAGGLAALRLAFAASVAPGDSVLVPAPSFSEYVREVRLRGGVPEFVDHDRVLDADPSGYAAAVVCNPNNPTGGAYDRKGLTTFAGRCREAGTVLVVDEAFLDFDGGASLAGEPGVVAARSLTKMFGLPGLRAGFAVAVGGLLDRVDAARQTWALSTPAARVGAHSMRQTEFVEATRDRVERERGRMRAALADEFDVHPSTAPFLLLDAGDRPVDGLVAAARERGVVVRDATTFRGLDSHIRVAVKRPRENDRLLDALSAAVEAVDAAGTVADDGGAGTGGDTDAPGVADETGANGGD